MSLSFRFLLALCFLTACNSSDNNTTTTVQEPEEDTTVAIDPASFELVWEDNFDGDNLDSSVWNFELGDGCPNLCGWGNQELQIYTDSNHRLEDGILKISIEKNGNQYTSTRISTKDKKEFQYGRIEARIKLPVGAGLWPAFWALGNDIDAVSWPTCGEIDIMEYVGRIPGQVFNSLHTNSSYGNTINTKETSYEGIEDDFHVYSIEWTPEKIEFFLDGNSTYTYNPINKNNDTWPFNKPFFLILNTAVGGTFGGNVGGNTIFPQAYQIDYVKVYQ